MVSQPRETVNAAGFDRPGRGSAAMRVLVTGATGFIGTHLVGHLLGRGDTVRALVRESHDAGYLESCGVEIVRGWAQLLDGHTVKVRTATLLLPAPSLTVTVMTAVPVTFAKGVKASTPVELPLV